MRTTAARSGGRRSFRLFHRNLGMPSQRSECSGSSPIGRTIGTFRPTCSMRDTSSRSTKAERISNAWRGEVEEQSSGRTGRTAWEQFDQIWFAGNHADIGGSYPENKKCRLPDSPEVDGRLYQQEIPGPNRVIVDEGLLKLYPSSDGMMHRRVCMVGVGSTCSSGIGPSATFPIPLSFTGLSTSV